MPGNYRGLRDVSVGGEPSRGRPLPPGKPLVTGPSVHPDTRHEGPTWLWATYPTKTRLDSGDLRCRSSVVPCRQYRGEGTEGPRDALSKGTDSEDQRVWDRRVSGRTSESVGCWTKEIVGRDREETATRTLKGRRGMENRSLSDLWDTLGGSPPSSGDKLASTRKGDGEGSAQCERPGRRTTPSRTPQPTEDPCSTLDSLRESPGLTVGSTSSSLSGHQSSSAASLGPRHGHGVDWGGRRDPTRPLPPDNGSGPSSPRH